MKLSEQYRDAPVEEAESLGTGVEATELIVHGVGGAPPTDLLDDHHPTRWSGDQHAGFYRPQAGPERPPTADGRRLDPERYPREAFAWGGLTSGDAARALWFLLLPYAFMNMAGWMLPRVDRRSWVVTRGIARVLAALGTVTLVMMSTQLSTDLLAYQCGWLNPSCRDRWWLSFLEGGFWSNYPSRIMVLAALIPLVVLAGIWAAGLLSFRNFEEYVRNRNPDRERRAELDRTAGDYDIGLEHPWFWRGRAPVHRMRRLHFQLGLVTLAVVLALSMAELTSHAWPWQAYLVVWGGTAAIVVLLAAIAVPEVETSGAVARLDNDAFRIGSWWVGWVLLGITAGYGLGGVGPIARVDAFPRLEGFIPTSTILTSTQLFLGFVLAVVVWRVGRGSFLRVAPAVVHALGWFMIMALWAGLGIRMADWFGEGQADSARFWITQPSTCTRPNFCYPIWFEDAAVAVTLLLFVTLLLVGIAFLRPSSGADAEKVGEDFPPDRPGAEPDDVDRRRLRSIARRLRHQRLVAVADRWLAGVVIGTLVVFLVVAFAQTKGWRFWSWTVTLSGWVVSLVPVVTVIAVRAGLNNPTTRRAIGSLFDVATFFPRRVHPFAPPCYGERAVPQLRWRLGWLAEDDDREIDVLARSHSQGTVVTAAALLQGVAHPRRVWLLTCGSPLVALYERHFPYYFGDIVERVGDALELAPGMDDVRWVHVTARTDVLGTPLRCGRPAPPTQIRVLDPVSLASQRPGDPPPRVLGHSCYHRNPVVEQWVADQLLLASGQPSSSPGGAVAVDCS